MLKTFKAIVKITHEDCGPYHFRRIHDAIKEQIEGHYVSEVGGYLEKGWHLMKYSFLPFTVDEKVKVEVIIHGTIFRPMVDMVVKGKIVSCDNIATIFETFHGLLVLLPPHPHRNDNTYDNEVGKEYNIAITKIYEKPDGFIVRGAWIVT